MMLRRAALSYLYIQWCTCCSVLYYKINQDDIRHYGIGNLYGVALCSIKSGLIYEWISDEFANKRIPPL